MNKKALLTALSSQLMVIGTLLFSQCDYNGHLVNPDDPITPYLSIKGQISPDLSRDFFSENKSARIGLMKLNNVLSSELMRSPDEFKEYYTNFFSTQNYPSINFQGSFPFNFTTEFKDLPTKEYLTPYRGPSGNLYSIGIFAIVLFDDVNRDGRIATSVMFSDSTEVYGKDSDSAIGISPKHFIVYVEEKKFTQELNEYINKHIGAQAQWIGLEPGFNLVTLSSPIDTSSTAPFTGIQRINDDALVSIVPITGSEVKNDTTEIPDIFYVGDHLFYFQRSYEEIMLAYKPVKILSHSNTITIMSDVTKKSIAIANQQSPGITSDPQTLMLSLISTGTFDLGYTHSTDPYAIDTDIDDEFYTLNSESLKASYMKNQSDTLFVESDTIRIGFHKSGVNSLGGALAPVYLDTLVIEAEIAPDAPWTVHKSD
jgi:hypothetical protein